MRPINATVVVAFQAFALTCPLARAAAIYVHDQRRDASLDNNRHRNNDQVFAKIVLPLRNIPDDRKKVQELYLLRDHAPHSRD